MVRRAATFRHVIFCVLALVGLVPSLASAEGHIKVSLKAAHPDEPGAKVIVTLTNTGNSPVHIMKWDTPFPPSGGRLARSLFAVTDAEGNKVRYLGSWVNFGGLKMQAFQLIAPGEVLTKEVDLASEYDFKPNSIYTIGYEMDLTREPEPLVVSAAERASFIPPTQTVAVAEPIHIFFGATVSRHESRTSDEDLVCSVSQVTTIRNARMAALRYIQSGESVMAKRYVPEFVDGEIEYRFEPHPRYARWFGVHDDAEPAFHSEGWGLNNNARVYETVFATKVRATVSPFTPKCGCPGYPPETAAHVVQDDAHTMYFCDTFFTLPQFDTHDSQIGTVIHEYTHYNLLYPGTNDYVYGHNAAEKLARENRGLAVLNADNFEFFFTDTTPYDAHAAGPIDGSL